ncbi:fatty acyl-AMP ligase [Micromonospora sp. NPDC007271]|uniref:fatty acyl-AMP ligase n=1 Tax=Micromonospora sp. NPDC007271 TaxID=3154587 RepID=UPI0033FB8B94
MADTVAGLLRVAAERDPDAVGYGFLADGETDLRTLTWGELERAAARVAALVGRVVAPGGRVLLVFEAGLDFVTAFFGCQLAGVAAVPVYPPAPARPAPGLANLHRVAADCGAELILAGPATVGFGAVDAPAPGPPWLSIAAATAEDPDDLTATDVRPHDLALLQYTSGSTGIPKGVVLRHAHLLANLESLDWFVCRPATGTVVSWLPMYHDMGLIGTLLYPLYRRMPAYLMSPLHFLHRPLRWLELITRVGATISGAPSFGYQVCVRRAAAATGLDLSSWEVAFNGAEPISAAVMSEFERSFAPAGLRPGTLRGCYGMAEATLLISGDRRGDRPATAADERLDGGRVTSGGFPPGHDVHIVGPDGQPVPDGTPGEVWFRGPSLSDGYWGQPEATAAAFGATLAGHGGGFLRTGDQGVVIDGRLFVTGRLTDLLVVRGRNVHPHDLERTVQDVDKRLRASGGVAVALDGPDGERVTVIQEAATLDPATLRRLALAVQSALLTHHQVPADVVLVPPRSIRKTSSGKLRRSATRDALLAGELEVLFRSNADETEAIDVPAPAR